MTKELGKLIATREGDRNYYYDKGLADGRTEGKAEGIAEIRSAFVSHYVEQIRSRMASGMTRDETMDSLAVPEFIFDQVLAELDRTDLPAF